MKLQAKDLPKDLQEEVYQELRRQKYRHKELDLNVLPGDLRMRVVSEAKRILEANSSSVDAALGIGEIERAFSSPTWWWGLEKIEDKKDSEVTEKQRKKVEKALKI